MKCTICEEQASSEYSTWVPSYYRCKTHYRFCSKECMSKFKKCRYCSFDDELEERGGYIFCTCTLDEITCIRKYELKMEHGYDVDEDLSDEQYERMNGGDVNGILDSIEGCKDDKDELILSMETLIRVLSKDHEHHDRIIDVMNSLT